MTREELKDALSKIAMAWADFSYDEGGDSVMRYSPGMMESNCQYIAAEMMDYMARHGLLSDEFLDPFLEEKRNERKERGDKPVKERDWPKGR